MTTSAAVLLVIHLLATAGMVGVIWFVQVVHYPLFAAVGADGFVAYENANTRLTSFVVGPLMGVEAATALWIALRPPDEVDRAWALAGLVLLAVIQASTIWLQVPQHAALSEAFEPERIVRLVRTNWVRTVGWTLRGALAAVMLVAAATP